MLQLKRFLFILLIALGISSGADEKFLVVGKFPSGVIDAAKETRVKFAKIPASLEELKKYECIVISPEYRSVDKGVLSEGQAKALRDYALNGGALFVTGSRHVFLGFEPFPKDAPGKAIVAEEPLRQILPIYSEPAGGAYARSADFFLPRMGAGRTAICGLDIKSGYPEFQKFLEPRLEFGSYNFLENKPETKVVAYTVQKKPEEHGYIERTIFGFTGRRGVLAIPVSGKDKSAESFKQWPSNTVFLKSCLKLLMDNSPGAFISAVKGPEKIQIGKSSEFELELLNRDNSLKNYQIGWSIFKPGLFRKENLLEKKNVVQTSIQAKSKSKIKIKVAIPAEFSEALGEYQLVFTLVDAKNAKVEHSFFCRRTLFSDISLELNPGGQLSFTDKQDAVLKVRVDGVRDGVLKILVTYDGNEILNEARDLDESSGFFDFLNPLSKDKLEFNIDTGNLPYGEYKVELRVFDRDERLLAARNESFFLDPEYEKNDFQLGLVSVYWYTHQLNQYYIKNMRRLGMSLCRGNFALSNYLWKAPIWRDKNTGKERLFDELLNKNMLSVNDSGEILCSDKNLVMESNIDISWWYTFPLPDYYRYGMEVLPIVGPSCTCWGKKWPAPWIYKLFCHIGDGKPIHYAMNHKGEYANSWSNIRSSVAFKPMVEMERNFLKELVTKLDKDKNSAIIPGFQVENEPNIFFTTAHRGIRDFNPANLVAFRGWLKDKYGDLATINRLFESKYENWGEIEPPRQAGKLGIGGPAAMLAEFKIYQDHLLADWLDSCMRGVHEADPEKICGTNSVHWVDNANPQYGCSILNSNNYFILASKPNIDYLGQSDHSGRTWDNTVVFDTIYSAGRPYKKFGWVTEGGNYFRMSSHSVESKGWRALFHGTRVYTMFSQKFFKSSGTSDMFNHDLSINEKSRAFGRPATFCRDNCYQLRAALPYGQQIGLLLIPEANYLSFAVSGKLWPLDNFHTIYKLLYYQNIPVRILDKEALLKGDTKDLKMIIVPDFKFGLANKYLEALKNYFDDGGNVLSFTRFGFQNQYFKPAEGPEILKDMGIEVSQKALKAPFCKIKSGDDVMKGHLFFPLQVAESKNNEIFAENVNGKPAVVRHSNGKGSWFYSATNIPRTESDLRYMKPDWSRFVSRIIESCGVVKPIRLLDEDGKDISLERYAMRNPENRICFGWINNPGNYRKVKLRFYAPDIENARFYDFDKQEYLEMDSSYGFHETNINISPEYHMTFGIFPEGLEPRQTKFSTCRPAFVRKKKKALGTKIQDDGISEVARSKLSEAHYPCPNIIRVDSDPSPDGVVKTWNVIGPFANPLSTSRSLGNEDGIDQDTGKIEGRGYDIDYLAPFGGEASPKAQHLAFIYYSYPRKGRKTLWVGEHKLDSMRLRWDLRKPNKKGFMDFSQAFKYPLEYTVAYAVCEIKCEKDMEAMFHLGSDDGFKFYLNGKLLGESKLRCEAVPDSKSFMAELKKGYNQVVLKIGHDTGGFGFYFRITDIEGKPVSGLKTSYNIDGTYRKNKKRQALKRKEQLEKKRKLLKEKK